MDIKELKEIWNDMNEPILQQQKLNSKIILEMTKQKYHQRIQSISDKEKIGAVICFIIVGFLIYILKDQDTWYLITCTIICIFFYLILPILSLKTLSDLNRLDFNEFNVKSMLIEFKNRKERFLKVQQLGIVLSLFLLFMFLPPVIKSVDNKDIFIERDIWFWYIPISIIALSIFARWGYLYYKRMVQSAQDILEDFA